MSTFHIAWPISALVLLVVAWQIGLHARQNHFGILIDERGRYSLTHFQTVLWTITILSSLIAVFVASGFEASSLVIPKELLGLMGISAGSAVLSTAVKRAKDSPGSKATVAYSGRTVIRFDGTKDIISARFAQIWLQEEGNQADCAVSITKYQNFILTLVIFVAYVAIAWRTALLPVLPENVVWLIGISHAGYVGGKVPDAGSEHKRTA